MTVSPDLASVCGTQLRDLGFELLDLGRDYETNTHYYYIFDVSTGLQVSKELLSLEEVQNFIHALSGDARLDLATSRL